MIKIASKIYDGRINATNILTEISVKDYLLVAENIVYKNEFQRKKVKRTSTVYSLLRKDLKLHCTIPPIVLAVSNQLLKDVTYDNINEDFVEDIFKADNLIILDGLQRTYNLIEVKQDLEKLEDPKELQDFLSLTLRIEFYIGINKIGILYRMLTLNTGQTPMSTRHQIEILYSDYLKHNVGGITFYRQIDDAVLKQIGDYAFDDVISGFNSYLSRDESGIDRLDILDNIANLEKLAEENSQADIFMQYIETYNKIALKFDELTNHWQYNEDEFGVLNNYYGKDILHIFTKAQTLSAYGAAIGILKDNNAVKDINGFDDIATLIDQITMGNDSEVVMAHFLETMDKVRSAAKKIGVEQRSYLKYFFRYLFLSTEDSFLNVEKTIDFAYSRYIASR